MKSGCRSRVRLGDYGGRSIDPNSIPTTIPKALDVFAPQGVDQATELNPLNGPVVLQGVTIP
jgi:hypothetical protein